MGQLVRVDEDGLLVRCDDREESKMVIETLRKQGFRYGRGPCGRGLYSPSLDRMLGEWIDREIFAFNPSLLHCLEGSDA